MTTPFAYDESTEVMRALAEVTIAAGVGAFVPQLVSRAGAQASVVHTETELWAFLEEITLWEPVRSTAAARA